MVTRRPSVNEPLLREQWDALRAWIEDSGLLAHRDAPSVLGAWNVHELVTHVGRSFLALTLLGNETRQEALPLQVYLASYSSSAQEIADGTKELARSFASDVLAGIDNCARLGFRALAALRTEVVVGPRGAIRLDDFVTTRLIELVVHGDDLARSVPSVPAPPLLPAAVAAVSQVLAQVYEDTTGAAPAVDDQLAWVRRATGRVTDADPALPLL